MSTDALYDRIAGLYDPWSKSVTEDVEFYVDEAVGSGGPYVELAVGTGRIAVPTVSTVVSPAQKSATFWTLSKPSLSPATST